MNKIFALILIIGSIFKPCNIRSMNEDSNKICYNIFLKSPLHCAADHSTIKITNKSEFDIKVKITYGYFSELKHFPIEDFVNELTALKEKKLKYCDSLQTKEKIGYNVVKLLGKSAIIPKDTDCILRPQNIVRHFKTWQPVDMKCILKISAKPVLHKCFSKIKSYLKSTTLVDVEKLHTNCFVVTQKDGKLCILYNSNHWQYKLVDKADSSEYSDFSESTDSYFKEDGKEEETDESLADVIEGVKKDLPSRNSNLKEFVIDPYQE